MGRHIFHPTRLYKSLSILALKNQTKMKIHEETNRQGPKWRSSLISQGKKRQVSQHLPCSACIFGISSHRYSWITLRKLYPQIRVECLLDLSILVRSCWAGACRLINMPEKFSVKKKSQKSRPESWAIPPTQHMLLSRSTFLCIPPPTHSPAVAGSYYNGTCGWTRRDREDWEVSETQDFKTCK